MKNKFIKMLDELYEHIPGELLSILSKNPAFREAGDEKTKKLFKELSFLYKGRMSRRKTTWWNDRHRILKELNKLGIVEEKTMLEYY